MTTENVKRLSFARIVGKVPTVTERTPLAEVFYHVNNITNEESPDGTFPRFGGEFKSVNLVTGDVLTSGVFVAPTALSDAVLEVKGDKAPNVTGHSILGVEPNAEGRPTLYVEHLISPATRSVIDMLGDHHAAQVLRAKAAEEKAAATAKEAGAKAK
jgi:hypothetical protein